MEEIIVQEAAILKDELTKFAAEGKPVEVPKLFLEMLNSVLWRMVTGRPVDKKVRKELTLGVRDAFKIADLKPLHVMQVIMRMCKKVAVLISSDISAHYFQFHEAVQVDGMRKSS